jgi:hypothetical protein
MTIKFPFPFTNRDFVEKRIKFMKDDSYYVYFSAAPSQVASDIIQVFNILRFTLKIKNLSEVLHILAE